MYPVSTSLEPPCRKKIRRAEPQPYHHGDLRRALIDTALQLVTEEQDWTFSLREVARRAGVSHRAPYNHFPEKLDLLAAVAAVGFERLRDGMLRAMAGIDGPEALLVAICRTYMRLGLENPALYRLMFGPALSDAGSGRSPTRLPDWLARRPERCWRTSSCAEPAPALSPSRPITRRIVALAALSVWSAVARPDDAGDRQDSGSRPVGRRHDREAAAHADRRSATGLRPRDGLKPSLADREAGSRK